MKSEIDDLVLRGMDQRVPALREARSAAPKPARGWLRAVRSALGNTQQQVASRIGVTRASYSDLESAEQRGAATLASLERAAQAMDCDLVYFLVPRESVASSFAELARRHDPDFRHLAATEHSMVLEGQGVGDLPPPPPKVP